MQNVYRVTAALLFALLAALTSPAEATVDNTVCSASDTGGTSCSGAQLKTNANEEIGALSKRAPFVVTVSGTNALTGCPSPAITSYVDGMIAQIKPAADNTGAVTVNWCTIGAVDAVSASGSALGAGDLQSTTVYQFRYYAANNQWRAMGTLGTGTATASAPYVTATASAGLSSERVLTAGTAIGLTDGGANTTLTVAVNDPELTCIAALTSAADKVAYYTGSGTCAVADLSSYARTLIDDANAAAARTTLGVVIGTDVQAYDADLAALAANSTTGFWAYTGAGTGAARTLTAPAAGFTITNPAGTAGNPTFALANDLSALEALASTGFAARTTTDTWAQRTLTAPAAGFTITNPAGVAGDPTFALANDLAAYEGLSANGIVARTATDTAAVRTITGTANEITLTNGDGVSGNPTVSIPSAVTFTGKTVTGGTFSGPAITTPGAGMTFAGSTSGTTTVAATAVAGTTALTLPAATDTLVGKATTDTLTNKTISGSSNTLSNIATTSLTGTLQSAQFPALTGDVTTSAGSVATTIANNAVTSAKISDGTVANADLANVATATFKGRTTAGTGAPEDLTATQATALLNNVVGDSGSGGTKGLVPAPASGDAAAGRFLKADGTWSVPAGGGSGSPGGSSGQIQYNNAGAFGGFTASGDATVNTGTGAVTIANDAVTYAKMQDVGANSVLANNTGSSGDVAEVSLSASKLLGRGSSGNVAAISLGTGLSMSGTTLNASGGLVYIGTVMGTTTNVDLALGATYSTILGQCTYVSTAGSNSATVAVSDDNASTYGTGLTFVTAGTPVAMYGGSFTLTGTGTAATNKVVTPYFSGATDIDAGHNSSFYSTTATESTKTGVTTHLRFVGNGANGRYSCTVYGIP